VTVGLLERVAAARTGTAISRGEGPLDPQDYWFNYGGFTYYGSPTTGQRNSETIEADFQGLVQAYKQNTVIWACERTRLSVFSEARFQFRQIRNGRPGDYFGTQALVLLEQPWTNGTTGDLLTRMLQEADFAGNAFYTVRGDMLRRMRPDWVSILMGSNEDPKVTPDDLDAELLGYAYWPGGHLSGRDPEVLLPDEVAHFAPTPDPLAHYRGMSWLTPVIREIQSDMAATEHKLAFFRNGATPQVVVSLDKDIKEEAFERLMRKMNVAHQGASNAYRTMYVGGGADVTVVGADLKQLDFKATQGAGESRIAAAAGVHPTIVGLSEGLQGSSLNAGNFGQARRLFAEGTLSMLWRNAAASLSTLVPPPGGSELWCDTRDVPFLREDQKDAAEIASQEASTIASLINAGYKPDSVVAAVNAGDWTLLQHTGLYSVQLQPPNTAGTMNGPPANGGGAPGPKAPALPGPPGRAQVIEGEVVRHFDPNEPRDPHTGKWGLGAAAKDVAHALEAPKDGEPWPAGHDQPIVAVPFKGGLRLVATSDKPGTVTITDGTRSLDLRDNHDFQALSDDLSNAEYAGQVHELDTYDADKPKPVFRNRTDEVDGRPFTHTVYALLPTKGKASENSSGEDTRPDFEFVLAANHDDVRDDLLGQHGVVLTRRDATKMMSEAHRVSGAERLDMDGAPVDVFSPKPGRLTYRMQDDDGNATSVTWNRAEYRRIIDALSELATGERESGDGESGDVAESTVTKLTIQTAAGPVLLQLYDPNHDRGSAARVFVTPQYDDASWSLAFPVDGYYKYTSDI
jgi:phage portal protein BeeE